MANTKQAKKRILQNSKKRLRNKSIISRHRTELKKLHTMFRSHSDASSMMNNDDFRAQLQTVIKLSDSAVNQGVYHRNKAARIKSRLFSCIHKHGLSQKSDEKKIDIASSETGA